jgi:SPP1 gp7 family putative phage head morphogenesis protein
MIQKTQAPPPSANERLLDAAVRHAVLLERLKAGEVSRIVGLLNREVIPDLIARIEARLARVNLRGLEAGALATQRYRDLIEGLQAVIREGMRRLRDEATSGLVEIGTHEAGWQVRTLSRIAPIEFEFQLPSVQVLRSAVTSRPFQGHLLKDWFAQLEHTTQRKVRAQLNVGLAEGEDTAAIVRRLRGTAEARYTDGILQGTRRELESVVRTSVNHVTTHAREETYKANADLVRGVQWVSTLDTRTTMTCSDLDGRVFPVDSGRRPPAHWGCRSTTVPLLKSNRELGLPFKDAPEGTRASMNGEVPASTTYWEWLERQPAAIQDEALGPARGALLRSGKVAPEQFVDPRGRPLTLKELARLEAA